MTKPVPIKFGTDGWRAVIADQYTYANVRRCAAGPGRYLVEQNGAEAGLKVTGLVTIDGYRFDLEDGGWLIVRFSGTEPLLRIYCETTHGERVQELLAAGRELAGG